MKKKIVIRIFLMAIFQSIGSYAQNWNLLIPSSSYDNNQLLFSSTAFDQNNSIFYSLYKSSSNLKIQSFNLNTNTSSNISTSNNPTDDLFGFTFDYSNSRLVATRSGRDNVFSVPASGGNWSSFSSGSFDAESYGASYFWNSNSNSFGYFGGYGFYSVKNWLWENNGIWNNPYLNNNTCNNSNPAKRNTQLALGAPNSNIVYGFSGYGNCDGDQFATSCNISTPWATDVGIYCWLKDLWSLDLTNHQFNNILPINNSSISKEGVIVYDYLNNTFYILGGYIPSPIYNPNYGNITNFETSVLRFRVGIDPGFVNFPVSGTPPPTVKINDLGTNVGYFDAVHNQIIWARKDGIWSINLQSVSDFSYSDTCYKSVTQFNLVGVAPDSVRWDFGDVNSGISNFGSGPFITHVFSNPTSYTVTMIAYTGGIGDTCRKTIQILDSPQPNLGSDFNLCEGTTQILNPGAFSGTVNYLWSDGSTGINYVVDSTEQVVVTITDGQGCVGIDTVNVTWIQIPIVNLGADASYCQGQSINLNAFWPNATYLWQDGSTNSNIFATTTGTYIAEVTVAGCTGTGDVNLIFDPIPVVNFGNDTTLCKGIPLFLDATTPNANYVWQDGSTNAYYFITDPGTYAVNVQVGNCIGHDTIIIDQQEQPIVELGEDTILCYGQPYLLDAYNYGATYQWSNGATTPTLQPNQPDLYYVLAQNQCGSDADSVNVILEVCNCFVYIPTAFSPNRDNKNETFNYTYNCTDFTADFTIYNRLGQVVFKSQNPDLSWDGTFEGKEAPEGVYYYVLKYKGYDSGAFVDVKKKGHVSLVR